MNDQTVLRRKSDIRFRLVGEEGVVVRQTEAEVLAINDVGARVLELLENEATVGELIAAMTKEYDVEPTTLQRSSRNSSMN